MVNKIDNSFNKNQYNTHAEHYLEANQDQHVGGGNTSARIALLQKYLPVGRRIFEIGSGGGTDAQALQQAGYQVAASDFSDTFLEVLKKKGLTAIRFDAKKDKLPEDVDAIYANAVFVHFTVEELKIFLQKIKKKLKNEKILFMSVMYGAGTERKTRIFDRDFQYYTEEQLNQLLQEEGFTILH